MGWEKTGKPRVVGSAGMKGGDGGQEAEGSGTGAGVIVILWVSGARRGEGRPFATFSFSKMQLLACVLKRRKLTERIRRGFTADG